MQLNAGMLNKPVPERGHLGVDARISLPRAAVAPGDYSSLASSDDKRATRVTLTGVLATGGKRGAYLSVRNTAPHGIGFAALALRNDGHVDRVENIRSVAVL